MGGAPAWPVAGAESYEIDCPSALTEDTRRPDPALWSGRCPGGLGGVRDDVPHDRLLLGAVQADE
ncbi:hypothetical protein [Streptomyces sp. Je 1-332]|uniref:hypothetical protein n=1 Tax=Streptomyces sp. Je 1-332 TaxID=3231270 RepID=UPI0034596107